MNKQEKKGIAQELTNQGIILGVFVGIFWVLEIVDFVFFHRRMGLDQYGIVPHNLIGLRGILFAPFLHGGFGHLIANTLPFITLGWLVMLQETSDFHLVTLITMVVSGLGTWLFGSPDSVHVGASGLIFGYLGFLLLRGFFQRNLPSIVLSIAVGVLYGGLIWGVLPTDPRVSWEGHLFGFIGGVVSAYLIGKKKI
ncbi:MAG: rhomboid family intramembrane serine protease [Spirulinaceae cyanobacterium]